MTFRESGVKTVGKLIISKANPSGIKADLTGCDVRLSKEFVDPEYRMDKAIRQENLARIAASRALKASPDIEI